MFRADDILMKAYRSVNYVTRDDPRRDEKLNCIASLYRAWKTAANAWIAEQAAKAPKGVTN